jgi:hypothetical protein
MKLADDDKLFFINKASKRNRTALSEQQSYSLGAERTDVNYANCGTHI